MHQEQKGESFILSQEGWILSPLYDVNPDIYGDNLSLNVNADDSRIDFDLAIESALYYGVTEVQAIQIVDDIKQIVCDNWRNIAKKYGISRGEIERMEPAFRECE